jgi:hypothetical protein
MTMWSGMVLRGSSMIAASDPLNRDFDLELQTQTKVATRPPDENSSVSTLLVEILRKTKKKWSNL